MSSSCASRRRCAAKGRPSSSSSTCDDGEAKRATAVRLAGDVLVGSQDGTEQSQPRANSPLLRLVDTDGGMRRNDKDKDKQQGDGDKSLGVRDPAEYCALSRCWAPECSCCIERHTRAARGVVLSSLRSVR